MYLHKYYATNRAIYSIKIGNFLAIFVMTSYWHSFVRNARERAPPVIILYITQWCWVSKYRLVSRRSWDSIFIVLVLCIIETTKQYYYVRVRSMTMASKIHESDFICQTHQELYTTKILPETKRQIHIWVLALNTLSLLMLNVKWCNKFDGIDVH